MFPIHLPASSNTPKKTWTIWKKHRLTSFLRIIALPSSPPKKKGTTEGETRHGPTIAIEGSLYQLASLV